MQLDWAKNRPLSRNNSCSSLPDWNSDDEPPSYHLFEEIDVVGDRSIAKYIAQFGVDEGQPSFSDIVSYCVRVVCEEGSEPGDIRTVIELFNQDTHGRKDASPLVGIDRILGYTCNVPFGVELTLTTMREKEVCYIRVPKRTVYSEPLENSHRFRHAYYDAGGCFVVPTDAYDREQKNRKSRMPSGALFHPPFVIYEVKLLSFVHRHSLREDDSLYISTLVKAPLTCLSPSVSDVVVFAYSDAAEKTVFMRGRLTHDSVEICGLSSEEVRAKYPFLRDVLCHAREGEQIQVYFRNSATGEPAACMTNPCATVHVLQVLKHFVVSLPDMKKVNSTGHSLHVETHLPRRPMNQLYRAECGAYVLVHMTMKSPHTDTLVRFPASESLPQMNPGFFTFVVGSGTVPLWLDCVVQKLFPEQLVSFDLPIGSDSGADTSQFQAPLALVDTAPLQFPPTFRSLHGHLPVEEQLRNQHSDSCNPVALLESLPHIGWKLSGDRETANTDSLLRWLASNEVKLEWGKLHFNSCQTIRVRLQLVEVMSPSVDLCALSGGAQMQLIDYLHGLSGLFLQRGLYNVCLETLAAGRRNAEWIFWEHAAETSPSQGETAPAKKGAALLLAKMYSNLSLLYTKIQDWKEAKQAAIQALDWADKCELNPAKIYFRLAKATLEEGHWDECEAYLAKLAAYAADKPALLVTLKRQLAEKRRLQSAKSAELWTRLFK